MANAAIQVFVSYARQDEALREELANHLSALKRNREIASWDNSCIEPGEEAEKQISRNLASAQIILLLVSSDYLASDELWRLEVEQAIARHQAGTTQVVPIILRPCDWQENTPFEGIAPLPKDSKPITRWEDQDEAFLDVVEGIRQAIKHLQQQSNFQPEESPYQGLEAFTRDKAKFFYGRQDIVDQLMKKLAETNFVPLIGISGIGKSSVVLAGLAPQLEAQGWQLLGPFKPGVKPLAALQEAFCSLFDQPEDKHEVYTLIETEGIERVLNLGPEDLIDPPELPKRDTARILLVIDQFEEIFTVCQSEDERTLFIQRITEISQKPNFPLAIVTTMREDFVESWLSYGSLIQAIQQQAVRLGSLEGEDLIKAIVEPAKKLGYCFGEGLLELILADVEQEKNCLPLLEFALTELWKDRDKKQRRLTATAYRQMGGVKGALNKRAEQIYRQLNSNQQDWVRRICLKLVRTGLDVKDISQRQLEEALLSLSSQPRDKKLIKRVINKLVTERLLVIVGDNYVELAYEDLMVGWCRFAGWREQNRDLRRLVQRVEDAEKDWKAKGKDDLYLLQGGILTEVREHWSTLEAEFTLGTQVFYQLSDKQEKKQVAFSDQLQAEVDLQKKAQKLMNLMSVRPLEAAAQAIQNMGESDRRLQGRMITSDYYAVRKIINTVKESGQFLGHMTDVRSVAFSPNSKAIVSGSSDRTVRLWDLAGQPIGEPFKGHTDTINSVAFSPDGQTILSGSSDRTVRLWDGQGDPIGELFQGHTDAVNSVVYTPDGQTIVSGSSDRTVRLWDVQSEQIGMPFQGHTDAVNSVAFSPNGATIVSGSLDRTIQLWDVQGNPIGEPFQGHEATVNSAVFSPDGQTIVSGSSDRTVRLWDMQGNPIGEPFHGHIAAVYSVAFNPDGQTIVSGSSDQTVRLWNMQGKPIGKPFQGHAAAIWSVAFSPDGQTIVSGSSDQTVRLWDVQGNPIGEPFQGHANWVKSVAFSPDGQTIVSGGFDQTVRLWDMQGNLIGGPFQGHTHWVRSVAFSPDGQTIVSGGSDQTVRLWDMQGNPIGEPFKGHADSVWSVAFSPDGATIVSGSSDATVQLWRGGSWRDWLGLCCDRFRYHPLFKNPQREPFISACQVCEQYVWSQEENEG